MIYQYEFAGPTLERFHDSDERRRIIIGPIRSGKSTASCVEIVRRAHEQRPGPGGIRRTRWAVIRDTMGNLERTTMATWKMLFGRGMGYPVGKRGGFQHEMRTGDIEADVWFFSLDHPDDVERLLSLELTGAYVNECKAIHQAIISTLDDRVGQYPPAKDEGCTWSGWWADTNPPDDDNWVYQLAEVERPPQWAFFRQPGGLVRDELGAWMANPLAENVQNLNNGAAYYVDNMPGKSEEHIRVMYGGEYGYLQEGRPVIHEYSDILHCAKQALPFTPGITIHVGLDFGLTPAAMLMQHMPTGQWRWIEEIVTERMGVQRLARNLLKPRLQQLADEGYEFVVTGDPAGDAMAQTDENTCFRILRAEGVDARPAHTNDFTIRREVLGSACSRLIDGEPGFLISPTCRTARRGLAKAYCFRKIEISGHAQRYQEKPDKVMESHVIESGQYGMMGAGAGRELTRRKRKTDGDREVDKWMKRAGSSSWQAG
jgi:hypothetical protein